ncbi:MAG: hypothetical protein AB7W16_00480 [Candidatus Obscuribacterales bacterium]
MNFLISLFAGIGAFILAAVLVVASMAAVGLSLMFLLGVSADACFSRKAGDEAAGLGFIFGLVIGLVWSIFAIKSAGIVTAFLSVAALCIVMMAVTGLIIYLDSRFKSRDCTVSAG